MTLAWHFTGDTLRDGAADATIGETLRHSGKVVICKRGLHASERVIDALHYKLSDELLRGFARQQARSVLHLWDAPV